jgi:hypothetical protein
MVVTEKMKIKLIICTAKITIRRRMTRTISVGFYCAFNCSGHIQTDE